MSESVETFGFENEEIKGGLFEKYKAKKGETHRLGIIHTDEQSMFAGSKVHFKDRYFLCKKNICCEKCGQARWRVGAVVVKYATNRNGDLKKPFSYEIFPWYFSEGVYVKLKSANSEFKLTSHDIKIDCTNDEYQHISITPCSESIWQKKEELKRQIIEEAKPIWDSVKKGVAADLTIEEIKDLIGIPTAGGTDPTTDVNLDDVLNDV